MATSKSLILLFLVFLVLFSKSETRSLSLVVERYGAGSTMKKYQTKTLMRELLQKSKELTKARDPGDDHKDIMPSRYYTNRISPGGPDPKHHSVHQ
ncbi:hypothetical protein TIFTF001_023072 [Ficus carica]|uniref:CLAVATA3/ESR (CLE)-related protein n=1 Tax=Ficus carica TaxID=3494 RepID=A0AA88AJS2_FICCA|nr:hypothetical protein TIFTF001_023072 [Ficus carica]